MCLGVVAILLLNVMEVFSLGGGAPLDIPCMVFQRVCVCCACDPNERQVLLPYVLFMFLYVGSDSSFKSLRAGSQVFDLLMLFLCVILHTMWWGKSLHLLCILRFGMLFLSATSMMFVKIMFAVCMLV